MSCAISPCLYSPLSPDSIRLIRLLPSEDENAPIQCQLVNYTLQDSEKRTHPYDALSYVWGSTEKSRFISIGEDNLPVTENLHKALFRLRYRAFERILWVDAICINQDDEREKEQQIPLMPRIYGHANCVVVWLGEAADNSDLAIEEIRVAGGKAAVKSSINETHSLETPSSTSYTDDINEVDEIDEKTQSAIIALFQRPWFQRIWVSEQSLNNIYAK